MCILYKTMKITLRNDTDNELKLECQFWHDICGNLYLKVLDKYFILMISGTDNIEFLEVLNYENLTKVENNLKYSKIKNTYEKNSLKGKIVKEMEEDDDDEIDEDGYYQNKHKVYPEDKLYTSENTNEEQNDDDDEFENEECDDYTTYYKFSKFGENTVISCLDRSIDVPANYDTFVINDNTSYVLTTLESNEKSPYRVSLFSNGKILLNVVGSKMNTYDLSYVDDSGDITIKCNNVFTKLII